MWNDCVMRQTLGMCVMSNREDDVVLFQTFILFLDWNVCVIRESGGWRFVCFTSDIRNSTYIHNNITTVFPFLDCLALEKIDGYWKFCWCYLFCVSSIKIGGGTKFYSVIGAWVISVGEFFFSFYLCGGILISFLSTSNQITQECGEEKTDFDLSTEFPTSHRATEIDFGFFGVCVCANTKFNLIQIQCFYLLFTKN